MSTTIISTILVNNCLFGTVLNNFLSIQYNKMEIKFLVLENKYRFEDFYVWKVLILNNFNPGESHSLWLEKFINLNYIRIDRRQKTQDPLSIAVKLVLTSNLYDSFFSQEVNWVQEFDCNTLIFDYKKNNV